MAATGDGDLAHAAGQLVEAAAEEVADAGAEDRQGQTGDVLVRAQADGQEGVDEAAQGRRQEAGQQAHEYAQGHVGRNARPDTVDVLIGEGGAQTGDAAQVHDARDAQVQIAALLGHDLAQGAEQNDRAEDDGGVQQGRK